MKISEIFKNKKPVFSLEIFPPKKNQGDINQIYSTLDGLKDIKPDFISVTYGAGGNLADSSTADICKIIKDKYHITPLAHLTCVNNTKEDVTQILQMLESYGIENILALRGDINPNVTPKTDFKHANELVEFIKNHGNFGISGACYPEGHTESPSLVEDILNVKRKVDAGAEHLCSQLFFDNSFFYNFREKTAIAGVNVPIEAGIMPVVNKGQIERMVSMCGASLPPKFTKMCSRFADNPEALREAGIAYAIDQIIDLLANDVDGIHLYTMNNPYVATKIFDAIKTMR